MKLGDLIITKYPKSSTFKDKEIGVIIHVENQYENDRSFAYENDSRDKFLKVLYPSGKVEESNMNYYYSYYEVVK